MKVAYFDYWTKGLHHFEPIEKALKAEGHETLLIHLGSLRETCETEEVIRGICCRDVRHYRTRLIHKILQRERPDVVLTLNARTVFDRALVISCRALGIRTVFLSHGIDNYADNPEEGSKIFEQTVNKFSFLMPRAGKYAGFILPNYFYSISQSGSGLRGLARGLRTIFLFAMNPGRSVQIPPAIDEVAHDRHLMFSKHAVESMYKMGYPEGKVLAVGNPKLDELFQRLRGPGIGTENLPGEVQQLVNSSHPYALVLEDSFPESTGMAGWTAKYRNQWLREMSRGLRQRGYAMVVKLHPGTLRASVDIGEEPGVVVQAADLNALIRYSSFCIAHGSTTVDICVLLDKPVVMPAWGLSKLTSDYFIRLGISRAWPAPTDPPDLSVDSVARAKYKQERITVLEPVAARNIVTQLIASTM